MIKPGQFLENIKETYAVFDDKTKQKYEARIILPGARLMYLRNEPISFFSIQNILNWKSFTEYDLFWKDTVYSRFSNEKMIECLYKNEKVFIFFDKFFKVINE